MAALAFVTAALVVMVFSFGVLGGVAAVRKDNLQPILLMLILAGVLVGFVSVMVLTPSFKQLYGG
jgi:hypothetical protein